MIQGGVHSLRVCLSPRKKLILFLMLSIAALATLLSVFKREVTYMKARSEGREGGRVTSGHKRGGVQLDKHSVEQALRRRFDEEASVIFVPGEEWAGSIDDQRAVTGGEKRGKADTVNERNKERQNEGSVGEKVGKGDGDQTRNSPNVGDRDEVDADADYVRDHPLDSEEERSVDVDYSDVDSTDTQGQVDEDYGVYEDTSVHSYVPQDAAAKPAMGSSDAPPEAEPAVQKALEELKACKSLDCIGKAHKKLKGKTKFNAPHYFLIGFQKCATTSVNNYLRGHPEYMPSVLKEAHYFTACAKSWNDTNCKANSTQDYIDNYLRISDAVDNGLTAATVDASVDYAWKGEDLAREIHKVFPWLKIVVMMREPISRVISYTRMWTQKGVRTSTHRDNRIACDDGEDLFDCLYPHLTPTAYTGHYAAPLEGWLKVWPADQIHVIQFEEFVSETDAVMRRLKKFLGLDPTLPENQQLYNVNTRKDSGGSPMKRREYRTLIEMARPDSERVADLLQKHGLAEKDAWMRRWQQVWDGNLKACGPDRICMINSN
jgi:hypothetical protein